MKNRLLKSLVLILALFSYSSINAYGSEAAKCAIPTFENEYDTSSAVFVGEVIDESKSGNKRVFEFRVKHFWKGVSSKRLQVSYYENPRYQAQFEKGRTYLIFAKENEDDGSLFDGRCSRSAEIGGFSSSLEDDLKKLGEPKTCIDLKEEEGAKVEKEN